MFQFLLKFIQSIYTGPSYTKMGMVQNLRQKQQKRDTEAVITLVRNQKQCFQGGKGALGPQLWSTNNFNRPAKGAGFFSPPKYLVPLLQAL